MSEDRVLSALRDLRVADAERQAGHGVEARLLREFRRRKRSATVWAAVKIAAAAVLSLGSIAGLAGVWRGLTRAPETLAVEAPLPSPPTIAVARPQPRPLVRLKPVLREVVTEFYPLMDAPPPFERGEVVRVSLPASALERAGFLVAGAGPDDKIPADVLFGEEGLARAIRFVSYQ